MFNLLVGVLVPFFGTALGAFLVFFMRDKISDKANKILLGFSSGVMFASSVWSLIIPAIEQSKYMGIWAFIPAVIGICLGVAFMLLLDKFCLRISRKADKINESVQKKNSLLFWAITIHNIPEGMAVGVAMASAYFGYDGISLASALALSVGIAIQNIPEGAIVSLPLKTENYSKKKAFGFGVVSGIVEPIFAGLTIFLSHFVTSILPYLLSFASGAMIFVAVGELIPESQSGEKSKLATISFFVGFLLMMILDIALG